MLMPLIFLIIIINFWCFVFPFDLYNLLCFVVIKIELNE